MDIVYEVYALTTSSSDVCEYYELEKAIKAAKEWSQNCDCEIVIEEVHRSIIKYFENGKEKLD